MLPLKKYAPFIVVLIAIVILSSISLLFIYVKKERSGCRTELGSNSKSLSLIVDNKRKWRDFIDTIGNCKNGIFKVYDNSGNGPFSAEVVIFNISDEKQTNKVSAQTGMVLYTYNIDYDEARKEANLILNFPETNNLDENVISNAVFLTSYSMFMGKSYGERDDRLVKF